LLKRVRDLGEVDVLFEGVGLKQVVRELSSVSTLEVPEDKVYPFVQVGACVVRLEGMSVLKNEVLVRRRPLRHGHILHWLAEVVQSKIERVLVLHEGAISEVELWGEFFVVGQ